jgi:hypothetical protein
MANHGRGNFTAEEGNEKTESAIGRIAQRGTENRAGTPKTINKIPCSDTINIITVESV